MPHLKKNRRRRVTNSRVKRIRQRLSPAIRRAQIIEAAATLTVELGYLPLPIEQLAAKSGVSKALFYTYFPDQYALFNRLLERELTSLLAGGLDIASQVTDIEQAAPLCGTLYFDHVAHSGPLLHILMADRYMAGRVERRLLRLRNAILRRLARTWRLTAKLAKPETLAAIEMMIAIPEEAGRLVFTKELDINVGRQLCRTLITSSLQALGAPDAVLKGLVVSEQRAD
jgi:AcrR family transcriptional regulator